MTDRVPTRSTAPAGRRQRLSRRAAIVLVAVFSCIALASAATAVAVVLDRGRTSPADPETRFAPTGTAVPVGTDPADIEAGEGFLWVSGGDGSLTRIDPDDGSTERIPVGGAPGQIVVGDGAVWVRNLGDRIVRVDVATGAVSVPIDGVGGPISGMTVGGGYVWLSHRDRNTVTRIDTASLAPVPDPIVVGQEPTVMEFDGGYAYVLGSGDGTLTRIDATSGAPAGSLVVGESLGGVEVDDGVIYVAADGGVVPVRAASFTAERPYTPSGWSYFEVASGVMWVVHDETSEIRRYDLATQAPVGEPVPGFGEGVGRARYAFDRLWLTQPDDDTVVALGPVR